MYQIFIDPITSKTTILKDNKSWIPEDELNPDYLEYVAWLFDGNTPEEWQPESETE